MNEQVLALDLGGTDLKAALCDREGRVLAFSHRPSRVTESAEAAYEAMGDAFAELRGAGAEAIRAIGLGCPGAIHPRTGVLLDRTAHLPHWCDEPVLERLAARFGLPVAVDNDANCAALAEAVLGAARGARVSLTVTVGTGVGMGLVVDGRVHQGARGGAGELGHLSIGSGELTCECGIANCVEPEMCGSGLAELARRRGLAADDAKGVFALAAAGEPRAAELIVRLADRLGAAIAIAVNLFDPEVVTIGGGVARAGDALLEPVRRAVARYALASHRRGLRLVAAELGERAGVVGAGLLAWRQLAAVAAEGAETWRK